MDPDDHDMPPVRGFSRSRSWRYRSASLAWSSLVARTLTSSVAARIACSTVSRRELGARVLDLDLDLPLRFSPQALRFGFGGGDDACAIGLGLGLQAREQLGDLAVDVADLSLVLGELRLGFLAEAATPRRARA